MALLRHSAALAIACSASAALGGETVRPTDPFGPATAPALVRELALGEPSAIRAARRRLASGRGGPEERAELARLLCEIDTAHTRYAEALPTCRLERTPDASAGEQSSVGFLELASGQPRTTVEGGAVLPMKRNWAGHDVVSGGTDGVTIDWVVDTGAEVTTMQASVVARLGGRVLAGTFPFASSTGPSTGRLAVLPEVRFGNARVRDVLVLVLPDDQLSFGDGRTLPAILGLPVLVAAGGVRWDWSAGTFSLGTGSLPRREPGRMYWHPSGVGLRLATALGATGIHLDTGANFTSLDRAVSLLTPAERASGRSTRLGSGGAGGIRVGLSTVFPDLRFELLGRTVRVRDARWSEKDAVDRIGLNALRGLGSMSLDFRSMRAAAK